MHSILYIQGTSTFSCEPTRMFCNSFLCLCLSIHSFILVLVHVRTKCGLIVLLQLIDVITIPLHDIFLTFFRESIITFNNQMNCLLIQLVIIYSLYCIYIKCIWTDHFIQKLQNPALNEEEQRARSNTYIMNFNLWKLYVCYYSIIALVQISDTFTYCTGIINLCLVREKYKFAYDR